MKKILSMTFAAILLMAGLVACTGGKQQNEAEATDSLQTATEVATDAEQSEEAEAKEPEEAKLNAALFGKWYNESDGTSISMTLAEKQGNYDGNKGYGYLSAFIDYEPAYTLVFTSLTPDGDNIKVHYNIMVTSFTGDPDDFDSEGEMVTEKTGEGDLTLIPQGGKVKIDSKDRDIKNKVLSKV